MQRYLKGSQILSKVMLMAALLAPFLAVGVRPALANSGSQVFLPALYSPLPASEIQAEQASKENVGAVYTQSNAAGGNEILAFHRAANGELAPAGSLPTGGLGTGAGLGSQGSVIWSEDGKWLFAVNAGSSDVSVFAVKPDGLELTDVEPSGGAEGFIELQLLASDMEQPT